MKPKAKPKGKPWITKLMEVLDELEDNTGCTALADVYGKIERAYSYAKEVFDELLELQEMKVEHEALLKSVRVFINSTVVDVEIVTERSPK